MGRPLKILHLANHCHRIGNGIINVAVDLACEQARQGHSVMLASGGGSLAALMEASNVRHIEVFQHWRTPLRSLNGAFRLRRLIGQFKPDIVHAHMMGGALIARALNAPRKFALVTSVHNEWQRTSSLMAVGDRVIAVSEAVRKSMIARGLRESRIRTVRNGPLGSPRAIGGAPPAPRLTRPSILTVCGLYERKGVADLIEAFSKVASKYPAAHLYIAGDGPDRPLFQDRADKSGLRERITFLGFVENPAPLFGQADIFALPSRSEPFELVFAEAREAGCAIVGAETGGIPEVLEFGAAGLLTPPRNPVALAHALDRLLGDPELRQSYARRARQNLEWLSCARMAEETVAVYRELLEAFASPVISGSRHSPFTLPRLR